MVEATVDENLCIGCGDCAYRCPEIFEIKDGKSIVVKNNLNDDEKKCAEEAAAACPTGAITVE